MTLATALLELAPARQVGENTSVTQQPLPTLDATVLYRRFAPRVYARCLYLLSDKELAKDATHDVFVKVHLHHETFRHESSPLTWLVRIATNHCLNLLRAKKSDALKMARLAVTQHTNDPGPCNGFEDKQLLRLALLAVPADVALVATLYFVDEMSQAEVAHAVGLSLPTLRKRLRTFVEVCRREITTACPHIHFDAASVAEDDVREQRAPTAQSAPLGTVQHDR